MNSLIKSNKLTKKIILQELSKMIYDHSININQNNLEKKIDILFEDCQNLSAERFIDICQSLRARELFGKLPANYLFTGVSVAITCNVAREINKICYDNLVFGIIEDEQIKFIAVNKEAKHKLQNQNEFIKQQIREKILELRGKTISQIIEVCNA